MTLNSAQRALLASTLWSAAGVVLICRGLVPYWFALAQESLSDALVLMAMASLLGIAKGWFVLRRTARRLLRHIETQPETTGLSALYPARFYLLMALMVSLGFTLRAAFGTSLPALVAGVYLAIGVALLGSTLPYFRYWRSEGTASSRSVS